MPYQMPIVGNRVAVAAHIVDVARVVPLWTLYLDAADAVINMPEV